ncbi:MAG TPA: VOC family protein [Acetobacteraceae bacterium]|jgi:2,3-dihydroxybiphenyl 1,2-dioxygenase|nr:VOC family protein [Acetobacteraceae bacterium]
MEIQALGYVGIGASDLTDWTDFATNWLGMQMVERGNACRAFRMDDRKQRLVVDRSLANGERYFGFEVADAAALDALAARLEAGGVAVRRESAALADQRCVRALISFADPGGNRLEAFWGAAVADDAFRPGRNISGFRTGPLGMGHAVFHVKNIDDLFGFYHDVLGFGVSDYILTPFRAYFMHVNPRHHTVALIETGKQDLHHLMVELYSLDDVGQGYDIALGEPERIATTLGRHPNDAVTSYYLKSPSGFMLEYGWGGREVTPGSWQASEVTVGPSLWGHDRTWLPDDQRAKARDMRLKAARDGMREPVQVIEGNYQRLQGVCPWWDSVTQSH